MLNTALPAAPAAARSHHQGEQGETAQTQIHHLIGRAHELVCAADGQHAQDFRDQQQAGGGNQSGWYPAVHLAQQLQYEPGQQHHYGGNCQPARSAVMRGNHEQVFHG